MGAHPRSRGEHALRPLQYVLVRGSSPLARGTRPVATEQQARPGLIPARAGNTRGALNSSSLTGAHPRSRGEHAALLRLSTTLPGSSPLARGTPKLALSCTKARGLIPARAGNTPRTREADPVPGAHPRSRGEHLPRGRRRPHAWGSSPLARGTPLATAAGLRMNGLIPARAGNTFLSLGFY